MSALAGRAPTLTVANLRIRLGGVEILRHVSLSVPEGVTVALIGRNGAGKTTTLRAIMGLVSAVSGELRRGETAMDALPAHRRARLGIGYAPEDRRMVTSMAVESNLRLPAQACRLDRAETAQRLERVYALLPELVPLKRRLAGSLSGGQQKMVALGRALIIGDRLLLLDEPFQGLAPALARRYAEALAGLRERDPSLSILVSESNPALLQSITQIRYTIERGEVTLSPEAPAGSGK